MYKRQIVEALGGYGIYGVECFVKGSTVYFNEVSPRPHDTGMVTLQTQHLNQFQLHLRAIMGLTIPSHITTHSVGVARPIVIREPCIRPIISFPRYLLTPYVQIYIFGKSIVECKRRIGMIIGHSTSSEQIQSVEELINTIIDSMEIRM